MAPEYEFTATKVHQTNCFVVITDEDGNIWKCSKKTVRSSETTSPRIVPGHRLRVTTEQRRNKKPDKIIEVEPVMGGKFSDQISFSRSFLTAQDYIILRRSWRP